MRFDVRKNMLSTFINNPALVSGIAGGLGALLVFAILFMTRAKFLKGSRWGMNFSDVNCPHCGEALPRIRRPKNLRQLLWGGWTCSNCNQEFDKWLNPASRSR